MLKRIVAFTRPAHIRMAYQQLKVQIQGDPPEEKSLPIEDIGVLMIDHPQITITSGAISALMQNNVALITCDKKFLPQALMLPFEGNHVQTQRMHAQISASVPLKKNLWKQTVQAKIYNQARLLESTGIHGHPLEQYRQRVKSGDSTNREAAAANFYWSHIFPDMPGFVRNPGGFYPNNLLNYGYAILRSVTARALVGAGLFPSFGIHHHNKYNAYCLADDIMEPYRPYVDRLVRDIMQEHPDKLEIDKTLKMHLLTLPHLHVNIDGEKSHLMTAMQRTATSLVHCFTGEKKKLIYPKIDKS